MAVLGVSKRPSLERTGSVFFQMRCTFAPGAEANTP
jgi:hypothetical protein